MGSSVKICTVHRVLRTRGRTGDASCTNATGPQGDTREPFCTRIDHEVTRLNLCLLNATRCCFVNLQNGVYRPVQPSSSYISLYGLPDSLSGY